MLSEIVGCVEHCWEKYNIAFYGMKRHLMMHEGMS